MNIFNKKLQLLAVFCVFDVNAVEIEVIAPPISSSSSSVVRIEDPNAINVIYITDRKYLDYTFASLLSVLENSTPGFGNPAYTGEKRAESLNFNLIVDEPNGSATQNFMKNLGRCFSEEYSTSAYNYSISYMHIPTEEANRIFRFNSYTWKKTIFLKLLFSRFLPYDRCLYLDTDTICVGDIKSLWNIDLGTHCFGACEHQDAFRKSGAPHIEKVYNRGVVLMDLEKMRENKFAYNIEELIKRGQKENRGRRYTWQETATANDCVSAGDPLQHSETKYTDEYAMLEYSVYNQDGGLLELDAGFNMCGQRIPRGFTKEGIIKKPTSMEKNGLIYEVNRFDRWKHNLTILHYYYWDENGKIEGDKEVWRNGYKPWQNGYVQQYQYANTPSYQDSSTFWTKYWVHNQWSFCEWYKHYTTFMKNVSAKTYEMSLLPEISPLLFGDKAINIAYMTDSKYWEPTFISLLSVLLNSNPEEREMIRFSIIVDEPYFDGTINEKVEEMLNAFYGKYAKDKYKYDVRFFQIPCAQREQCSQYISYAWPNTIFLKLFLSKVLPYNRCLYLDGDTLCVGDISDLWKVDLGTHCFGASEHYYRFIDAADPNRRKIYNAGVILMDLEKMRTYDFVNECNELVKANQKAGHGHDIQQRGDNEKWYVEETAMHDYSDKHTDKGVLEFAMNFNMRAHHIPLDFDGTSFSAANENGDVLVSLDRNYNKISGDTVEYMRTQLSQLVLIHYYYWEPYKCKPWDLNRPWKYRKAGCPSYEGAEKENPFWKTEWKHNPWSFVQWYKHYKMFQDAIKD
ncbi:hypothetical protein FACS189472_05800 [Alphaproteobacteria bacterium]|nr:hypothetical protein FACS189472_05800 [Alphaproteobacteria bacterium]